MKKFISIFFILSTYIFANIQPLHVELDLYKNRAILKQSFDTNSTSIELKVPTFVNLADIKIKSNCEIKSYTLSQKKLLQNSKKEKELNYQLKALEAKNNLLHKISVKGSDDFEKVEEISNYIADKLIENLKSIEQIKNELQNIKKDNRFLKEYKLLDLKFTCKDNTNNQTTISYPYKTIKQSDFYNIYANTNDKSITIEKLSNIFYKGLKDLKDVDINLYSYAYNTSTTPMKFYPKYIGEKREIMYKAVASAPMQDSANLQTKVTYSELTSKSKYTLKNQTLISNQTNLYSLDKEFLDANFQTYIDAYGTNKAYIEASFKSKKNFEKGVANLYLDSNPIANKYIKTIKKDIITKLYFGEDEHIQVKKELIKTLSDKTFFGDKTISTQNWKYTITNKKPFSTNINFVHRVPVSKDANIKIKIISEPKYTTKNANGKIQWRFKLEANQKKDIIFGYEVIKDE